MIVITNLDETPRHVISGDQFLMTIEDEMGYEVIIREKITTSKTINFIASFRFALEDGTCPGFHLTGIFGCKSELPKEIREAKMLSQLTKEQLANFERTVGISISKKMKRSFSNFFKKSKGK